MKAISLPFRIDGYGRVATTTDMTKIYADRVKSVVMTVPGERVMRPAFGSGVPSILFDSFDEALDAAKLEAAQAFQEYLPGLGLDSVVIDGEDQENGELDLQIQYSVPASVTQTMQSLTVQVNGGN